MEASALPAPSGLARTRISIGAPLLRVRSDEQLVALFRDGHNDAFRVIYDRYRQRLFAYTRQMLPGARADAEDALQDVFVRAYGGLRANDRELALRPWLYRIAHNRCIDELRRPAPPAPEVMELVRPPVTDPIASAEQRESLRRLIADVRRLPEQQRSALLMRELVGMTYAEIGEALGVSIPAIKSLLVRARVGLAQAAEARETACVDIREDLVVSHDRGVRASGMARRHLRDCPSCREFRVRLRGTSRQFASLVPAIGPLALTAKLLGFGGGAGSGAAAGGSAAAAGGAVGSTGTVASVGALASTGALAGGAAHVATILAAAAVVTAGGAVGLQHTLAPAHHNHHRAAAVSAPAQLPATPSYVSASSASAAIVAEQPVAPAATPAPARATPPAGAAHRGASLDTAAPRGKGSARSGTATKTTGRAGAHAQSGSDTPDTVAGTVPGDPSATTDGSTSSSDPAGRQPLLVVTPPTSTGGSDSGATPSSGGSTGSSGSPGGGTTGSPSGSGTAGSGGTTAS